LAFSGFRVLLDVRKLPNPKEITMAESLWYATCTECAWMSEPTADQAAADAAGQEHQVNGGHADVVVTDGAEVQPVERVTQG
jgi:hypothetical protein